MRLVVDVGKGGSDEDVPLAFLGQTTAGNQLGIGAEREELPSHLAVWAGGSEVFELCASSDLASRAGSWLSWEGRSHRCLGFGGGRVGGEGRGRESTGSWRELGLELELAGPFSSLCPAAWDN